MKDSDRNALHATRHARYKGEGGEVWADESEKVQRLCVIKKEDVFESYLIRKT